jgi:catechol 2,3-dioxygenase-like lactoylglutathione lyase family enzyme
MIRGIHHTAVSTSDLERSLRFYRDLLGFKEVYASAWEPGTTGADRITGLKNSSARLVMLKAGNACIELFQFASPRPKTAEPMRPVCDHGITRCGRFATMESPTFAWMWSTWTRNMSG